MLFSFLHHSFLKCRRTGGPHIDWATGAAYNPTMAKRHFVLCFSLIISSSVLCFAQLPSIVLIFLWNWDNNTSTSFFPEWQQSITVYIKLVLFFSYMQEFTFTCTQHHLPFYCTWRSCCFFITDPSLYPQGHSTTKLIVSLFSPFYIIYK